MTPSKYDLLLRNQGLEKTSRLLYTRLIEGEKIFDAFQDVLTIPFDVNGSYALRHIVGPVSLYAMRKHDASALKIILQTCVQVEHAGGRVTGPYSPLHGAFWYAFSWLPPTSVQENVADVCNQPSYWIVWNCLHAVGHGLIVMVSHYSDENIDPASRISPFSYPDVSHAAPVVQGAVERCREILSFVKSSICETGVWHTYSSSLGYYNYSPIQDTTRCPCCDMEDVLNTSLCFTYVYFGEISRKSPLHCMNITTNVMVQQECVHALMASRLDIQSMLIANPINGTSILVQTCKPLLLRGSVMWEICMTGCLTRASYLALYVGMQADTFSDRVSYLLEVLLSRYDTNLERFVLQMVGAVSRIWNSRSVSIPMGGAYMRDALCMKFVDC